jgi:hypothetical protein
VKIERMSRAAYPNHSETTLQIMSGLLLNGMFPPQVTAIMSRLLAQVSAGIALETPLPGCWPLPIVVACC